MRINKKLIKRHRHASQIKLPVKVKTKFAKAIQAGNVPSNQQLKLAVKLGLVKQTASGHLNPKSLIDYFKTFIQQRKVDDSKN